MRRRRARGQFERDYTKYLKTGALKGARVGIARDFMGKDAGTDAVVEAAIATLKKLGAVVVDPIKYPDYILQSKGALYNIVTYAEFKAQIADYLKTSEPHFPKTLDEIVARANDPKTGYRSPEKAVALKYTASVALDLTDPSYIAAKNEALVSTKAAVMALFEKYRLDAIVYPTSPRPAQYIKPDGLPAPTDSPTNLANESGFPDLIVPAGVAWSGLPVTISFFGRAFSEGQLLGYGYDFEQATKARVLPKYTPGPAKRRYWNDGGREEPVGASAPRTGHGRWSLIVCDRSDPSNAPGALVDLTEQRTVINDVPNAVGDFFQGDVFAAEGVAEERLTRLQAERAGRAHAPDLHVRWIVRVWSRDTGRWLLLTSHFSTLPQ